MSGSRYFTQSGAIGLPDELNQGAPGESSYIYIGYASDDSGSDFSTTPASNLTYISFYTSDVPITPTVGYFSTWVKFIGSEEVLVSPQIVDTTLVTSEDIVLSSPYTFVVLTGNNTGGFSLGNVGTPIEGDIIDIVSVATIATGQSLTLLGTTVHSTFNTHDFKATGVYTSGSWKVVLSSMEDGAVGNQQLLGNIANSKLQYPYISFTKNSVTTQVDLGGIYDIGTFNLETEATGVLTPANGGTGLSGVITGLLKGNGTTYSTANPGTDYLTGASANTLTNKIIAAGSNTISDLTLSNFNASVVSADGSFTTPNNTTIPTTQAVSTALSRVSTGVKYIQDVDVLSDVNLDLSGDETVDGILISTASPAITRVLCIAQTTATQNGVYTPNTGGAWTRATDQNIAAEIGQSWVHVQRGTTYGGSTYICKNYTTFTLATDDIIYEEAPQLSYDAGNGLDQTGATFSIDTAITVDKTSTQTLSNKTLTSPVVNTPDINGGTVDAITSLTVANDVDLGAYNLRALTLQSDVSTGTAPLTVASTTKVTNLNADSVDGKDVGSSAGNIPELATGAVSGKLDVAFLNKAAPTGAIVGESDSQTLTGKTISGSSNTLSNIAKSSITGAPSGDFIGSTDSQTMSNKTLTSPVLNTGVSGTAILDEDNMASNSATKLATQQSIKAYVDATSNRWQPLASTSRVSNATFTSTTLLEKGTIIKYLISGTYYYGQIVDRSGSGTYTYTISGAAMSSNPTSISYDAWDSVEMVEWFWSGTYATADTVRLINSKEGKPASIGIRWDRSKAYLVGITAAHVAGDSGATTQPKIQVTHAGDGVNTAIELRTSVTNGGADFSSTYYDINYGESIDIAVTKATGGTPTEASAGLWIQLIYVKA